MPRPDGGSESDTTNDGQRCASLCNWLLHRAFATCHVHRICRSTASWSLVLTRGGICVPPTVTYLPYRVSGSILTAVGCSQLSARWPGTVSRILSGIQRAAQSVSGVYLKRTCSRVTSASSALGVLNDYALGTYTNPRTHSITHFEVPFHASVIPAAVLSCVGHVMESTIKHQLQ